MGTREIGDQAGLAEAGLAGDQGRLAGRPIGVQAVPLGLPADQPRRSQHADGQGPGLRGVRLRATRGDACPQGLGLRVGRDAEGAFEHVAAAIERGQRGGPVAAQVVQSHQAPMGVLGSRVEIDQALRGGERRDQLAGAFESRGLVGQGADAPGATLLARPVEPVRELAGARLFETVQQFARAGLGGVEMDLDIDAQAGHVAAFEQVAADRLAQAKQALAQVGARPLGIDVGPEQRGEPAARRRTLDRQVGEQQRILLLEHADRPVGANELRIAGEMQGVGAGGSGHGDGARVLEAGSQGS